MNKLLLFFALTTLISFDFVAKKSMKFDICHSSASFTWSYDIESGLTYNSTIAGSDDCNTAMVMPVDGSLTDAGTTVGATNAVGEPRPNGLTPTFNSVWYQVTLPAGQQNLIINFVPGSINNAVISIYPGTTADCGTITFSDSLYTTTVTTSGNQGPACLPPGQSYLVQVASTSANEGTYSITFDANGTLASNDDCAAGVPNVNTGLNNVENTCSVDGMVWFEHTIASGDHITATTPTAGYTVAGIVESDCTTPVTPTTCLSIGDVVYIQAGNATPVYGPFVLNVTESANPTANDDCANATNLAQLSCTNSVTGAGNNAACPDNEATCNVGLAGVWYSFTTNGQIDEFEITGTDFEVFTGAGCGALTTLGCDGDATLDNIDPTVSGNNYIILVFGGGSFTATADPQTPANDLCTNAIALADNVLQAGTTSCATGLNTSGFCGTTTANDHAVAYSFTTPGGTSTYDVSITLSGVTATTVDFGVFTSCGGAPFHTSCGDGNTIQCLLPNTTYFIGVGSPDGDEGTFNITASATAGPEANDLCSAPEAIVLTGNCEWTPVAGDNTDACPEAFAGACGMNAINTTWYSITLPATATGLDFMSFTGGAQVEVFTGACTSPSTVPAGGSACISANSFLMLPGGSNVLVAVTANGAWTFEVRSRVPPVNDLCTNATALTNNTLQAGTTDCATGVNSNGFCGTTTIADHAVYYSFTTPAGTTNYDLTITLAGVTATTVDFGLYTACNTAPIHTSCVDGNTIECLLPNTTYIIAVGSPNGDEGSFNITANATAGTETNDLCSAPEAIVLTGNCEWTPVAGDNTDACPEAFAGACGMNANNTTWYSITLPATATGLDFMSFTGGAQVQVFTGTCTSPATIPGGGSVCISANSFLMLPGGSNVLLAVTANGAWTFEVRSRVPPINDLCTNATVLTNNTLQAGTTGCATGVNSNGFCGTTTTADHAVYYSFTTPAGTTNYDLTITLAGVTATTVDFGIYTACNTAPVHTSCVDGNTIECLLPNTTYIIAVGSPNGDEGSFNITANATAGTETNDLCSAPEAIILTGNCEWTPVAGDNTDACPEAFAGACGMNANNTTWYSITLPATAIGLDFMSFTGGAQIQAFTGTCTSPATIPGGGSVCVSANTTLTIAGGSTVLIAVTANGAWSFDVRSKVPPINDICANAPTLTLGTVVAGTTSCATITGENVPACGNTATNQVWYTYTVPSPSNIKTLTVTVDNYTGTGNINLVAVSVCNGSQYYDNNPNYEDCGTSATLEIDCPAPGSTIKLAVSTTLAGEGDFDITIDDTQAIVPANDACANATDIVEVICDVFTTPNGNNEFACPEAFTGGCNMDNEEVVWYSLTLPADAVSIDLGINTYSGTGAGFFSLFSNCTGTQIGGCNTAVSNGDPVANGVNIDVSALAGTTILIAFGSTGDDGGVHRLDIKINNNPDNDLCTNAVVVTAAGTMSGTTECATSDVFDPGCQASYENTVWYTYTIPAGGAVTGLEVTVTAGTATGDLGVMLIDIAGNCNNAAPTIYPDANNCDAAGEVVKAICLDPGDVIHIVVGSTTVGQGTFDITFTPIMPVASCIDNDECANAQNLGQVVSDADCIVHADCNENACPDVVGNCNGGQPVNNVVWYQVQNDGLGDFINVTVSNSDFPSPVIGVFVGTACNALTQIGGCEIGSGNDGSTGPIDIDPNADPIVGQNYYIAVGTVEPDGGDFDLCITLISGCVNDEPCDAIELDENVVLANPATTVSCTADAPNPDCTGSDISTVWYKFTVPPGKNGVEITINNVSITGNIGVQVGPYTAANPACDNQQTAIQTECFTGGTFTVPCLADGQEYYIQVSSGNALNEGAFNITFEGTDPIVDNDLCSQIAGDPNFLVDFTPADYCKPVTITGTNVDACPDPTIAGGCIFTFGPTVWYQVTIPNDPNIQFLDVSLTEGTLTSGQFSLLQGPCNNLTPVPGTGCENQGSPLVNITINPGDTYYVAVGTRNGVPGDFSLTFKLTVPPDNDECVDAIEIPIGGSETGTTECATNSNFPFTGCVASTNESDVWYAIPVDNTISVAVITINGFTGSGNFAAQPYYSNGGCTLAPIMLSGSTLVDCTGDKEFSIPMKCLDPTITHIYVKVGSSADDGVGANEQGEFTISVEEQTGVCDFADECDEITSQVVNPVTDPNGVIDYECIGGCLQNACPQDDVNNCGFGDNPTVWFQVNTDLEAAQLYISVVTSEGWTPVYAVYSGTCDNLTLVPGGTMAEPTNCNTDDSTPDVHNVGVIDPPNTYYIAVSGDGLEPTDAGTFTFCAATAISQVACLGGIPPDYTNHTCDPQAMFVVLDRSNDPDGSLGLPLEGPFCPGEEISLRFNFFYDASVTGQDWLQGIVPSFGAAVDITAFDPANISVSPGGAQWFGDNAVVVNENVPNLCTYIDANGQLKICNALCELCPCTGPLTAGTEIPGGWYWVQNGGAGCANDGNPNTMYGIGSTTANIQFDLKIKVKQFNNEAECEAVANDLTFALQTFSDGVTGCWEDPLSECLKDVNQIINYAVECDVPPAVIATPNPVELCSGDFLNVDVVTEDGSTLDILYWYDINSSVVGMTEGTFTGGEGTITDQLFNFGTSPEVVEYYVRSIDPLLPCPGPVDTVRVTVYPEIKIEFDEEFVCLGFCLDLEPATVTGGKPPYLFYQWSNGGSTRKINVCPTVNTTYILTVTDVLGCTMSAEVEVEVIPTLDFEFPQDEYTFCQDPFNPLQSVSVEEVSGSGSYNFVWESNPGGLVHTESLAPLAYGGDTRNIFPNSSLSSPPGSPYLLCVEISDQYNCKDSLCTEVNISGSPEAFLELASPLNCGDLTADLNATFSIGLSNTDFNYFELLTCNGTFVATGTTNPFVFQDVNIEVDNCFELLAYNEDGCFGTYTFNVTPIRGDTVILNGPASVCQGAPATISVQNASLFNTFQWGPNANNATTSTVTVTPVTTTTYSITATNTASGCSDIATIRVEVNPNPTVQISGSTSICAGSATTLQAISNPSSNALFSWRNISTNAILSNADTVVISSASMIEVTSNVNGCIGRDTVNVTSGADIKIIFDTLVLCTGDVDTLRAGLGFLTYEWRKDGILLPNTSSNLPVSMAGVYRVDVTTALCLGSGEATVAVSPPPQAIVTDSVTVCRSDNGVGTTFVNFNSQVLSANAGVWDDLNGLGVDLSNLNNVNFIGLPLGSYPFVFTTNDGIGICPEATDTMYVNVISCPCPVVATRPIDDYCNDEDDLIALNQYLIDISTQVGNWSIIGPTNGITITNDSMDISGATGGTVTLRWSISSAVGICPDSSEQVFTIFEAPVVVAKSGNFRICNAANGLGSVLINIDTLLQPGADLGSWQQLTGPPVNIANLPLVDGTGLTAGDVLTFRYTTSAATDPCEEATADITVTVRDCNCPSIDISTIPDLCNDNDLLDLNNYVTTDPFGLSGSWSSDVIPNPITGSNFNASGIPSGSYIVTFTLTANPGGNCVDSATAPIIIRRTPDATVIATGSPCNINSSGNDSTNVDLDELLGLNPSAGTWVQTSGTPTLAIGAGNLVEFDGQSAGSSFQFTYTTTTALPPCENISRVVTVNVRKCDCPDTTTIPPAALCNTETSFNLATLETANTAPGVWTVRGPTNNFITVTNKSINTAGLAAGNYALTYTLNPVPAFGCAEKSTQTLTIQAQKTATVTPTAEVCSEDQGGGENLLNLNPLVTAGDATGKWFLANGLEVVNPSALSFIANNPGDIVTVNYVVTNTPPCVNVTYPVTVTVLDCDCPIINVNDGTVCSNGGVVQLAQYGDANKPGRFISTAVTIVNNNSVDVTNLSGNYKITYKINTPEPDCPDTASFVLSVIKDKSTGIAIPASICGSEDSIFNLVELLTGEDTGGTWKETSVQPSTAGAFNSVLGRFNTTNQAIGTYNFVYTQGNNAPCADKSTEVNITIKNVPPVDAGEVQTLDCSNLTAQLGGTASNPNFSYAWTHGGGTTVPNGTNAQTSVNFPGVFTLVVTDNTSGCQSSDKVTIEASTNLPIATAEAGQISCFNANDGSITFTAPVGGTAPYQYSINGGQTYSNNRVFANLAQGTYEGVLKDAIGCVIQIGSYTIVEPAALNINLGDNQVVTIDDIVPFSIDGKYDKNRITSIVWTANVGRGDSIVCQKPPSANCDDISIIANEDARVCVTIADDNGCSASDCVDIQVLRVRDIDIPQIFAPDSEGNNVFFINDKDVELINEMLIFDRWGNKVFAAENIKPNDPTLGWNGKFNGKFAEQGVYVYYIKLTFVGPEKDRESFSGDITLIR